MHRSKEIPGERVWQVERDYRRKGLAGGMGLQEKGDYRRNVEDEKGYGRRKWITTLF